MRSNIRSDNAIAFDRNKYKSAEDFQKDVGVMMDTLTKQGYMCSFRYEDVGIFMLEFDHDNPEFGSPMIYWLDCEQADCLFTSNYIGEEDDCEEKCCCCKDVG